MELTREQIKEGNEKLAKLLGWYQDDDGVKYGHEKITWYENGEFAKYVAYSLYPSGQYRDLPFHRDWNYLMKVVDKIGALVYHRKDDEPDYNWKEHYSYSELFSNMWNKWVRIAQTQKGELNLMNDVESIWSTCVAWIDWYEQNKDEI